jgi:predicted RNA-binding Zn-ribbon protein involved in translation (DUF1610 family)
MADPISMSIIVPGWPEATFTSESREDVEAAINRFEALTKPIPMRLTCPACGALHVDRGAFASKPHHTHACQSCGAVWRPAVVNTVGVQFLPGFRDDPPHQIK